MSTTDTRTSDVEEVVTQLLDWNPPFSGDREELQKLYRQTLTSFREKAVAEERARILGTETLPDRLRETRLHLGLSQEEVGKRLGYSAMAISHFEKGSRPIPDKVLGEFVMIFGSLVETKANNRRGKALTPPKETN